MQPHDHMPVMSTCCNEAQSKKLDPKPRPAPEVTDRSSLRGVIRDLTTKKEIWGYSRVSITALDGLHGDILTM